MDRDDRHHDACLALLQTYPGPLIVPMLVIAEATYLIGTRLGPAAETRFIGDIASGIFTIEPVQPADRMRIAELVWRYRELPLGTTDASVVATAERLGIGEVATLDHRDFRAVRPAHVTAFDLRP